MRAYRETQQDRSSDDRRRHRPARGHPQDLRPPTIKTVWQEFAAHADEEGWPAARFLAALAEHEFAERDRRRMERHLTEARLLPGKSLDTFDFDAVPVVSKAQVMASAQTIRMIVSRLHMKGCASALTAGPLPAHRALCGSRVIAAVE